MPPQVSASSSGMAEPIISTAPSTSSLCLRSWRGMRARWTWISSAAASPSGTLSQKITDQSQYSASMPPSTGPSTPDVTHTTPI